MIRQFGRAVWATIVWAVTWYWDANKQVFSGLRDGIYAIRWYLPLIAYLLWAAWVLHDVLP